MENPNTVESQWLGKAFTDRKTSVYKQSLNFCGIVKLWFIQSLSPYTKHWWSFCINVCINRLTQTSLKCYKLYGFRCAHFVRYCSTRVSFDVVILKMGRILISFCHNKMLSELFVFKMTVVQQSKWWIPLQEKHMIELHDIWWLTVVVYMPDINECRVYAAGVRRSVFSPRRRWTLPSMLLHSRPRCLCPARETLSLSLYIFFIFCSTQFDLVSLLLFVSSHTGVFPIWPTS